MSDMFGVGTAAAAGINAAANIGIAGMNNMWAAKREKTARAENYKYGEMAADSADARTRALYNDLYSPQAQLQQIKDAGLSPSLFYGDGGGISGQAGAQGSGAAGVSPTTFGAPPLELGEIFKTIAETGLINAEKKKIESETNVIDLQKDWQDMVNKQKSVEFDICTMYLYDKDDKDKKYSMYELAQKANTYDQFLNDVRSKAEASGEKNFLAKIGTEYGQQTMRNIYMNAERFDRDINVLSAEGVDAEFQKSIIQILSNNGGAEQSASTMLEQMKAAEQGAKLTNEQQSSWNHIIEKLRAKNSTAADIIIVLAMILNQAASNWSLPNVRYNHNTSTSTNTNFNVNQ